MRRPAGTCMFLIAVATAIGCKELEEGSSLNASTTGPDETTSSSSISATTTSTMMETITATGASATAAMSSSASASDPTTSSDTGDTTESVITTDETSPPTTTDETVGTTEPATSSSSTSSSSTGMSECNYFPAGGCGNCMDSACCVELMECDAGSMQCQPHLDCLVEGGNPSQCAEEFGHPSTHDLRDCIEANCMPPCT